MSHELLALLIEVTSVAASEQRLKKPITGLAKSFRSDAGKASDKGGPQRPRTREETKAAFDRGVSVLAATARGVRQ